ncbi:hypothetical protein C8034_v002482 [Colletotrichum sidae]|uniref:Uncharacterized protein n=1 Tax=Colletotrichum sidae TaxID=1347389 RepID=A0A4R8SQD5_9PEZI|nr:hypothetical protein C8034_v002482 [Colletotrichum sidae]
MSRASKVTLSATSLFAACTIVIVHFQQKSEKEARTPVHYLQTMHWPCTREFFATSRSSESNERGRWISTCSGLSRKNTGENRRIFSRYENTRPCPAVLSHAPISPRGIAVERDSLVVAPRNVYEATVARQTHVVTSHDDAQQSVAALIDREGDESGQRLTNLFNRTGERLIGSLRRLHRRLVRAVPKIKFAKFQNSLMVSNPGGGGMT